jgi:outer membrane protein assembly factor BamB
VVLALLVILPGAREAWAGAPEGAAARYFRSDQGVAGAAAGALPERFDEPGASVWHVPVDPGQSTPVVCGGRLFLTTYSGESGELATLALDAGSGDRLWRQVAPASKIERFHDAMGSAAVSTPACDDSRVYVFFGSCGLLCYDFDGRLLWQHALGPFQDEYGAGSSPILVGDQVILNEDHDRDSFLIALDARTGATRWISPRPDAVRSYATPTLWTGRGRPEVLVAGALELAAYDPGTGRRLWWAHGLARIVIPTPVTSGDRVYVASWSPGGDTANRLTLDSWQSALGKWDRNHDGRLARAEIDDPEVLDRFNRMDLDRDGSLDEPEWNRHAEVFRRAQNAVLALRPSGAGELDPRDLLWKHQRGVPYVASPLLDRGILWLVKDGGIVTKLDAASGRLLQEERLPGGGGYYASPVAGDGKVFCASEQGVVTVLANAPDWRVISTHDFRDKIYATPLIDRGRIYLRTGKTLHCFQRRAR